MFFLSNKYNGKGTCKYISYLLCDEIRKKHGICDETTFNMFKDFVDTYNNDTTNSVCMNQVEHLNVYEFIKMKALYELYDIYMSLSPRYALQNNNYCVYMLKL
ncbi:hypothetical protein PCYB_004890, partial [Plasmodium cynomolgi strain B]